MSLRRKIPTKSKLLYTVAWSTDGKLLATGGWDNYVKLWDPESGQWKGRLAGHKNLVLSVAFSPEGRVLATGSTDKTVRLWDTATGTMMRECSE